MKDFDINTQYQQENSKRYFLVQPQRVSNTNKNPYKIDLVKWGIKDCGDDIAILPKKFYPITEHQGSFPLKFEMGKIYEVHFILFVDNKPNSGVTPPLINYNNHTPLLVDTNDAPIVFNSHFNEINGFQSVVLYIGWVGQTYSAGDSPPILPLNIQLICADYKKLPFSEKHLNNYYSQDPQIGVQGPQT